MANVSDVTKETQTISEIIVERLKLSPKELKDFESAFETLGIDLLVDHPSYEKRFSRDIRDSIYDSLSSIYKKSALARPLFLKYILDKERNFIEEVITKEFLKSLVGKFKQCCENNIKSLEQKIDNLENDKSNPSEQRLRKLQLSCEQYSAQVQAEINQVNRLIKTVKSYLLQFQIYDNCSDIIGAREKILSDIKKYSPNTLHDMLPAEVKEKFIECLKQLDPVKTKEKFLNIRKAALAKAGIITHIRRYIPNGEGGIYIGTILGAAIGALAMMLNTLISMFNGECTKLAKHLNFLELFFTVAILPFLLSVATGFALGFLHDIGPGTLSFVKERYDNFCFSKLDLLKEMESIDLSSEQEVDVSYRASAPKMDTTKDETLQSNVEDVSVASNASILSIESVD